MGSGDGFGNAKLFEDEGVIFEFAVDELVWRSLWSDCEYVYIHIEEGLMMNYEIRNREHNLLILFFGAHVL